jgi:hypothetical protein
MAKQFESCTSTAAVAAAQAAAAGGGGDAAAAAAKCKHIGTGVCAPLCGACTSTLAQNSRTSWLLGGTNNK